jgi:Na+/H+ antiporter NhaC
VEATVNYGLLTLLPPIFVIVFAVLTRRTFESLLLGAILGYVISDGLGFFPALLDTVYAVLGSSDTIWLLLVSILVGPLILMFEKSKAPLGFAKLVTRYATTPRKTAFAAYLTALATFIDEYLSTLTVGAAMKKVFDRNKLPREHLAMILSFTAASKSAIIPVTSWFIFFSGVFGAEKVLSGFGKGTEIYISAIPFIFYGWLSMLIVPLMCLGIVPIFGPIKKAYQRVAETGEVYSKASARYNMLPDEDGDAKGNIWLFIVPIIGVLAGTIYFMDILYGLLFGIILLGAMSVATKALTFNQAADCIVEGFANMMMMVAIICAALILKTSMANIGLPEYVVNAALPFMIPKIFPAVAFLLVATLSFITGSNWGIPAVMVPILIPLAVTGGANAILTVAAVASGAVFGSNGCFYSDCTILAATTAKVDAMDHNITKIPYALLMAAASFVLYIIFGMIG